MPLSEEEFRQNVRWVAMSMVPQAAMNALNPVIRVGDQVSEPAMIHLGMKKEDGLQLALKMFQHVGVPADFINRYPFELSGGMRQRVAIAMALVTSPSLIVLDEPTTALDLLTQANIFNVLKRIKKELGTSFILITHDIATSSELADDVAVMYAGQIVETGRCRQVFPRTPASLLTETDGQRAPAAGKQGPRLHRRPTPQPGESAHGLPFRGTDVRLASRSAFRIRL